MGRKIIAVQNAVIAAMFTQLIARVVYSDVNGWRLVFLCVAVFWLVFRTLDDITVLVLKGVKDDKKTSGKSNRGTVPGIVWHTVRLKGNKQKDRHTAKHPV